MAILTTRPRGTNDFLPAETPRWQYVERTLLSTAALYGYGEIRTPTFEHTELFQRGVGDTTDVVNKEMYTFTDKGDRSITLRPEGTAGICRAAIEAMAYQVAEAFEAMMEHVRTGTNPVLVRLHEANLRQADISGMASAPLVYQLDAAQKRILHISSAALLRIFSCAYAYRAIGDRKYLEHAENDINTVCSFADWNGQRHFLDVGEMAAAVALGYDWLYADLKPETRVNAERALREYAFTAAGQYGANFYKASNNWNQVCNAGLVCAALAIYETCPETAQAIIEKSLESNRTAVKNIYSPDGNYTEGYGYWEYGSVFEVLMLTALETAAGSDDNISATTGFDRTSEWLLYMVGMNNQCFNFSVRE